MILCLNTGGYEPLRVTEGGHSESSCVASWASMAATSTEMATGTSSKPFQVIPSLQEVYFMLK